MFKDKNSFVDTIADFAGNTTSALVGAGFGTVVAGPLGTVGGAMVGTVIEKVFVRAGKEIKNRLLSQAENQKIGTVFEYAKLKINANLDSGKELRDDDFFVENIGDRSAAEEILYYFLIKRFNYIGEYDIIDLGDGYGIKIQV